MTQVDGTSENIFMEVMGFELGMGWEWVGH
jgi:hypothetical protein